MSIRGPRTGERAGRWSIGDNGRSVDEAELKTGDDDQSKTEEDSASKILCDDELEAYSR